MDNFSFIVDVYSYLIRDFNPYLFFLFLDSKCNNEQDREMIHVLWQPCISSSLHDYIRKPENFEKLYSGNNSFKEADLISNGFVSISKYYEDYIIIFKILYNYLYKYFQNVSVYLFHVISKGLYS